MTQTHDVGERTVMVEQHERVRFGHVVKHLYARKQRWDMVVADLPSDPRQCAREGGCARRDLSRWWRWVRVEQPCRDHVLHDHDRYYLRAALESVKTAIQSGDHAVVTTRQGVRELFVGDNAVLVLLMPEVGDEPQRFVTATRNPPSTQNPTNADFHRKAVRKLRDKTSLGSGGPP